VLATGAISNFTRYLGRSTCSSAERMEGLYIKWEENGQVMGRYKYVRSSFLQAIEDEGVHWMDRPLEQNLLRAGTDIFAP